tara:strand:+ start:3357 stop:3722 length:366 start_codon:yes stop_codon:yes gene_type:complete
MEVQKIAIERALRFLNAAGCKYCILEADGTKHGTLEVAAPKKQERRASRFPRGAMLTHYKPFVQNMKAGDSVLVPYGEFGADEEGKSALRGALGSWCSATWGNKTYITHNNAKGVELLRVE